eukprot:COSAG02_NODE_7369_length_3044_cov_4.622750_2_plen_129_part_00
MDLLVVIFVAFTSLSRGIQLALGSQQNQQNQSQIKKPQTLAGVCSGDRDGFNQVVDGREAVVLSDATRVLQVLSHLPTKPSRTFFTRRMLQVRARKSCVALWWTIRSMSRPLIRLRRPVYSDSEHRVP